MDFIAVVVPAHAGVVPTRNSVSVTTACGPRARGGGPDALGLEVPKSEWSPRTRGWSVEWMADKARETVVPAHAGVVPG